MTNHSTEHADGLRDGFTEQELIEHGAHPRLEHAFLYLRNLAAGAAAILFLASILHAAHASMLKAIAYFLGALAYFGEILILTDCFRRRVPHRELFMAYCFGPLYILLGVSYLLH